MSTVPFWIRGAPLGRLATSPQPVPHEWLREDLAAWKDQGADIVVSLLGDGEMLINGLADEADALPRPRAGVSPVPDHRSRASGFRRRVRRADRTASRPVAAQPRDRRALLRRDRAIHAGRGGTSGPGGPHAPRGPGADLRGPRHHGPRHLRPAPMAGSHSRLACARRHDGARGCLSLPKTLSESSAGGTGRQSCTT